MREVFEAQTMLNIPRFLMMFLCGVVFPVTALPPVLKQLAYVLPLTYTVEGLQQSLGLIQGGSKVIGAFVLLAFIPAFIFPAVKLLARKFS